MTQTTTSGEAELAELKFCTICKRKGHYAKEHKEWSEIND